MIEINISTEYIKLGQFLKFQGLISNGSEAKEFLGINEVIVNGVKEQRRGKKLYPKDRVIVNKIEYVVVEVKWYI